ncbi:MAG: HAMP domain-containing histidine kinase [Proteobacteria bacterium]|nr:HAMP domain-containing histidine kinase [Pseudomonadota bacterium]
MGKKSSLRRRIMVDLGVLTLVIVIVYTLLIGYFMIVGMGEVSAYDMYLTAKKFSISYEKDTGTPLPQGPRLKSYVNEENLPPWLRKEISPRKLKHGKAWLEEIPLPENEAGRKNASESDADQKSMFIILPYDLHDGNRLYLLEIYLPEELLEEAFPDSDRLGIVALTVGIGFIFIVLMAVRFIFYRLSIPLRTLSEWATTMGREKQEQPRPDFHYQEINQLADIIQNAVQEKNKSMRREHHFLRNASHELRTPIAILRSNIDLLERLRPSLEPGEKIPRERIKRAVEKMQWLTESLLWLSRKESKMPGVDSVDIDNLVKELILENQYLLTGKKVDLSLDLNPTRAMIPLAAGNIVLGNLIRNAFQYTIKGRITISARDKCVIICNCDTNQFGMTESTDTKNSDYGFGLGLDLVDQISKQMGWEYENIPSNSGHQVTLKF